MNDNLARVWESTNDVGQEPTRVTSRPHTGSESLTKVSRDFEASGVGAQRGPRARAREGRPESLITQGGGRGSIGVGVPQGVPREQVPEPSPEVAEPAGSAEVETESQPRVEPSQEAAPAPAPDPGPTRAPSPDADAEPTQEADADVDVEPRPSMFARVAAAFRSVEDGGTGLFRFPELWSQSRPPLSEVWAYLREAPWTTTTGVWRMVGIGYSGVAFALVAFGYVLAWLAERPTRLALATALIFVGYLIKF